LCQTYPFISRHVNEICDVCHLSKQRKLSYLPSLNKASKIFELIYLDIWGPYSKQFVHGGKYFLTILVDFSCYTWTNLLKFKAEVQSNVEHFINFVETQFEIKVKNICFDNGHEFSLKYFMASKGILHQTSCIETPQQNGRFERKHQHILNVARTLMFQSHLPINFWSYVIKHVVYLINQVPSPIISNKTPFELLFKQPPDFVMLKVFGCLCYASTHVSHRHKFDPRARRGIFLGYQNGIKGYVIFYFDTKEFFISRNVQFNEMIFLFNNHDSTSQPNLSLPHGPTASPVDPFPVEPTTLPSAHRHNPAVDQPINHTIHFPSTCFDNPHSTTSSFPFETPSPHPPLNLTPQPPPR